MLKRLVDIILAFTGLLIFSPVLIVVAFLVWKHDKHSPFYIPPRVGKNEKIYYMVKMRSMVINADKSGVDSTSTNDNRVTKVGLFIRKFKLDEITQLWNVLLGDMSLVGPRPNVKRETDLYTAEEKKLLSVKPGITDISSIVFSDEGEILAPFEDPDLAYNQLIRPWKSRLGLLYIEKQSLILDIYLIALTAMAIASKKSVLKKLPTLVRKLGASEQLIDVVKREKQLTPFPPPGSDQIVQSR